MLKRFLRHRLRKFERALDYDASYMHQILDASLPAFLKFGAFQTMSAHREGVPATAKFAASLAGTLSEDCGPCTQIVVDLALRAGVGAHDLAALLRGDVGAASDHAAFGFRFGDAVARRGDALDALVGEARARYGERGLVTLSFAVASARVYPAVKRGLGHAAACTKVRVGPSEVWVKAVA